MYNFILIARSLSSRSRNKQSNELRKGDKVIFKQIEEID